MELNTFLQDYFTMINETHLSDKNDFNDYENFRKFIYEHYSIIHLENNNYIKFVKVIRQMIRIKDNDKYNNIIDNINSNIRVLSSNQTFPNVQIKKYMFRFDVFIKLIDERKRKIIDSINTIKELYEEKGDFFKYKFKVLICINTWIRRYITYCKYSTKLLFYINKLIELEVSYGIDHKLIELNNLERSFLGKKSEYTVNKVIFEYINKINLINKSKKIVYFYETNIDLLKLLNIKALHNLSIKGEIDGMIISYDGNKYIIEKIIEVKSSINSTFMDIDKFIFLQNFIKTCNLNITYDKYIFTIESFNNIISKNIFEWTTYICINKINYDIVEKSHLYFTKVFKIIDDFFINDFYVNGNENCIKEKFQMIIDNREKIDFLFENWKSIVNFNDKCNVFISK